MDWAVISINGSLLFVYMTLAFLVAYVRRRLDTVDVAWGIGFILVAWSSYLQQPSGLSLLLALLVSIWGARLSTHIGRRSFSSHQDDQRYTKLTRKWKGNIWARAYWSVFLLQGALILIVSLPVSLVAGQRTEELGWLTALGVVIWLGGFIIEVTADRQLRNFLSQPNHPKIMQRGLWRYSRHPNYFGELTQWYGLAAVALQVNYGWLGLIGPLTLTYLIIFISGLPPIERPRADDPDYQRYKRRTSALIPLPRRNT